MQPHQSGILALWRRARRSSISWWTRPLSKWLQYFLFPLEITLLTRWCSRIFSHLHKPTQTTFKCSVPITKWARCTAPPHRSSIQSCSRTICSYWARRSSPLEAMIIFSILCATPIGPNMFTKSSATNSLHKYSHRHQPQTSTRKPTTVEQTKFSNLWATNHVDSTSTRNHSTRKCTCFVSWYSNNLIFLTCLKICRES